MIKAGSERTHRKGASRQNSPQLLVKSATTLRAPFFFVANESRYLRMPPYSDTTEATDRDSTYSTNPVTGRKENRLALEMERERERDLHFLPHPSWATWTGLCKE